MNSIDSLQSLSREFINISCKGHHLSREGSLASLQVKAKKCAILNIACAHCAFEVGVLHMKPRTI